MIRIALAVCIVGLGAAVAQPAAAAQKDSSSAKSLVAVEGHMSPIGSGLEATLTFSNDVQVPGATLPAGTYLFTLVDATTMRVVSPDGAKVWATFPIVQVTLDQTTAHGQLRFERLRDGTTRLLALYPKDSNNGYTLIFKKTHKSAAAPVPTTGSE